MINPGHKDPARGIHAILAMGKRPSPAPGFTPNRDSATSLLRSVIKLFKLGRLAVHPFDIKTRRGAQLCHSLINERGFQTFLCLIKWVGNEWFEWLMDAVGRLRPGVVCCSGQAGIGKQTPAGIGHYARILTQIYPLIS